MITQVAGVDELGCRVVAIPNGAVGEVLQILPSGLPGYGPGGGPTVVGLAVAGGALQVTVNGVTASLLGVLAQDLAGNDLGYWLPLA